MPRRDGANVAWHEVPGTAPPQKSRPVEYGLIWCRCAHGAHFDEKDLWDSCARSHRTLRNGSFGTVLSRGRFPRHFVPGYDRGCSYGTRGKHFADTAYLTCPRKLDLSPEAGLPECRCPFRAHHLKTRSQGKPWAKLSWPFGPKTRPTYIRLARFIRFRAGVNGESGDRRGDQEAG